MSRPRPLLLCVAALAACSIRPTSPGAASPASTPEPREGAALALAAAAPAPANAPADAAPGTEEPHDESDSEAGEEAGEEEEEGVAPQGGGQGPAPASRYAALGKGACEAELRRRKIGFQRVDSARGVVAPVRLAGALSGVTFRSNLPEKKRSTAAIEIYDCRLVLALDDFAKILAKHGVVEVVHLSVYRPVSKKRTLKNGVGRRHSGALAIDAAIFKTGDGRTMNVAKDFRGRIGAKTCPPPKSASELRQIACEASDARLFNVLLTPDYNRAHHNHFHLEVTANARWFYVR